MRQTALTKSRSPDHVIGWTNFSLLQTVHDFVEIFNVLLNSSYIYFARFDGSQLLLCLAITLF